VRRRDDAQRRDGDGYRCPQVALRADAMFDARGTLGMSRDIPVGIQQLTIIVELDTSADDATLAKLAQLTERYCVVGQSLAEPPRFVLRRAEPTP
jgi:hypothetical protein